MKTEFVLSVIKHKISTYHRKQLVKCSIALYANLQTC